MSDWVIALLIVCVGTPLTLTVCLLVVGWYIKRTFRQIDEHENREFRHFVEKKLGGEKR